MTREARGQAGGAAGTTGGGSRPGRLGNIVALVVWATVLARVFAAGPPAYLVPWYVGGLLAFLAIQLFLLWRPALPLVLLYVAFALQAALVLVLLSFDPNVDFLTALLALEAYQAAILFAGRTRYVWVGVLVALIAVSLVLGLGLLRGLSLAFVPMAAGVVLAMFAVVSRQLETARVESQGMVADLQGAQRRLEAYAGQVEELAAIDERSRVARELQGSVSTTIADILAAVRSARDALGEPERASPLLERLRELTQQALAEMRRVIAELRPPTGGAEETQPPSAESPDRM